MGFLSNLLKPKNFIHMSVNPVGATMAAARGGTQTSDLLPQNILGFNGGQRTSAVKADPATSGGQPGAYDPSMLGGDPNDPAYGSFAKPFTVEDFYANQDPGYSFELQQGTQALQNAASAGSGAFSGAALKDLLGYSQQFARTGYDNAFNRFQTSQGNIFSRLAAIAQLGQNAAAGVGTQGTQLAGNAGQLTSNSGSAAGAGLVGAGNNLSNGITNYWLLNQLNQQKPMPVAAGVPGAI